MLGVAPLQHVNQHLKQDMMYYPGSSSTSYTQPAAFQAAQQQQHRPAVVASGGLPCYQQQPSSLMGAYGGRMGTSGGSGGLGVGARSQLVPTLPALMGGCVPGLPVSHHHLQQQQTSEAMCAPGVPIGLSSTCDMQATSHQQQQQQGPSTLPSGCSGAALGLMADSSYGANPSRCPQQQGGMLPPSTLPTSAAAAGPFPQQLTSYNSGSFNSSGSSYSGSLQHQQHQQRLPALNMNSFGSASEAWAKVLASPNLQPNEITQLLALMGGGKGGSGQLVSGIGGLAEDQSGSRGVIRGGGSGEYPSVGMRQQ
jgi:hypothetical protein